MATTQIKYVCKSPESDPDEVPVIVIGRAKHLAKVAYSEISHKLGKAVAAADWDKAVSGEVGTSSAETFLYSNKVVLAKLPNSCSRHNAPAKPFSITKFVKGFAGSNKTTSVVIVCNRPEVYASGCAVARAYSVYSRKTSSNLVSAGSEPPPSTQDSRQITVEFICPDMMEDCGASTVGPTDLEALDAAATGIRLAARIVDTPCNEMHTDAFIQEAKSVAESLKLPTPPTIIRGEELAEKGFGGIYGVGKAALHPPALVVLSHEPKGATQTIAWVGKGIVYDTGGLSIKGKTQMPGMKRDCGGAAGILGAFYAAVKQGFDQNLHAIFCLAENAVGDRATRPDDIHTLYSGRTVEINNTDAEGRLVVSDGVVYANRDLKADVILDMCTLTGAQGISTGRYHAAHLTNSADWEEKTFQAGLSSGDLSFPLVYCPELHFPEFYSAVADMKNSVADRNNAQSSCAGLFINAHLGFDFPGAWVHVDMAAPVHTGERATGYGVALLNTLFGNHINCPLLKLGCPTKPDSGENGNAAESNAKKMRLN